MISPGPYIETGRSGKTNDACLRSKRASGIVEVVKAIDLVQVRCPEVGVARVVNLGGRREHSALKSPWPIQGVGFPVVEKATSRESVVFARVLNNGWIMDVEIGEVGAGKRE